MEQLPKIFVKTPAVCLLYWKINNIQGNINMKLKRINFLILYGIG